MHGPRNIRKPKTAKLSSRPKVPREPFTISGLKSSFGLRVEAPVCKCLGPLCYAARKMAPILQHGSSSSRKSDLRPIGSILAAVR